MKKESVPKDRVKTIRDKYGEGFYSDISKKRKTFSGGKTFQDKDKARAAQAKGVISRRRNLEALRKAAERAEGKDT